MTERITAMGFEEVLIGYSLELCGRATRMMLEARADSDQPGGGASDRRRKGGPRRRCGPPPTGAHRPWARPARRRPSLVRPGQGALGAIGGVRRPRDLRPARRARPDGAQTSRSIPPTPTTSPPPPPGLSSTTDAPGTMRPAGGLTPKPVSPGRLRASPNSSAARGGSTTTTSTDSPPRVV